jgi:hypothetical protein
MPLSTKQIAFENVWLTESSSVKEAVAKVWKNYFTMNEDETQLRAQQLVFIVRDEDGEIIGISTAYKVYIKQLRNFLYAVRFMILPQYRIPGLLPQLVTKTREFLESIHDKDHTERCIGLIALIENEEMKKKIRAAILPSGFVYIGNSGAGHHIRVYYFKGARITP